MRNYFRPLSLAVTALFTLSACSGPEPTLPLSSFAAYQRDQVTTRLVPAHTSLARRLAQDGWRSVTSDAGETQIEMTRDRSRIWFYSANGECGAVDLEGVPTNATVRSMSYRVNSGLGTVVLWPAERETLELDLVETSCRQGWNALDLYIRETEDKALPALRLAGFRFSDSRRGLRLNRGPETIQIVSETVTMPSESLLDLAFEAPADSTFVGRAAALANDSAGGRVTTRIELLDDAGSKHELTTLALDAGDKERISLDLSRWAGEPIRLRIEVDGPPGASLEWSDAGLTGEIIDRAEPPIRPSRVTPSGRLGRPDVLLVILDAARFDAFGTYGGEHPTPNVDGLAKQGTRFEKAFAPASWTGQSIPALLSGFYPDTVRIERWGDPFPEQIPTLAELASEAGYRTVLWSQHPIYNRAESLVRGFEVIRYSGRRKRHRYPNANILFEADRPTFAVIHLLPPHSPYTPPPPFRGRYTAGYKGKVSPKLGALSRVGKKRVMELNQADRAYIFGRYLETVAFADWLVGRVVATTKRAGRFGNSMIVVTSDHGEAFLEHDLFMHSRELYQEFIRIPLVVKWPVSFTGFASSVTRTASLVDIAPTLVDGLDLPGGSGGFQGESLLPSVADGLSSERWLYGTTRGLGDIDKIAKPRWMLEDGTWRVIHDPIADRTELYSVDGDPAELEDLAEERPALTARLLQRLLMQRYFNLGLLGLGQRDAAELDPEMVEELKALGYL